MLVRLYGSNFRSLKEKFELSTVAADLKRKEDRDRGVIEVPIKGMPEPLRLLRVIALYGPNASGKSTVLTAGRALNWLATESSASSRPEAKIPPYEPFMLDHRSSQSPVEFGCDVTHETSLLRYEIAFESTGIQREVLTILDGDGEDRLIDRHPTGEIGGRLIECSKANTLYVQGMQPNVSVLSKLAQHGPQQGDESVRPFYQAIRSATRFEDYSAATLEKIVLGPSNARFADDVQYRDWIMDHLMRAADFGICDMSTRRESFVFPKKIREQIEKGVAGLRIPDSPVVIPDSRVIVSFIHEGDSTQLLDPSYESSGTKKILNIADDWWRLAHEPITLLADELARVSTRDCLTASSEL